MSAEVETAMRGFHAAVRSTGKLRARPVAVVLVAAFLLAACSGAAMFYHRLDWWAQNYVSDFVEFSPSQEANFQKAFNRFHLQHCLEHLPEYDQWLVSLKQRASTGRLDYEFLGAMRENVRGEWDRLVAMGAADAVALLRTFNDAQLEQLKEGFVEANREFVKYRGDSPEKGRKLRRESMVERLEYWLGDLTDEQLAEVDRWTDAWQPDEQMALATRVRWQSDVLNLLARGQTGDDIGDRLYIALVGYRDYRSAEYQSVRGVNEEATLRFLAQIVGDLNQDQVDHLGDVVERWRERLGAVDCSRVASAI